MEDSKNIVVDVDHHEEDDVDDEKHRMLGVDSSRGIPKNMSNAVYEKWDKDFFMKSFKEDNDLAPLAKNKSALKGFYEYQNSLIQGYVEMHQLIESSGALTETVAKGSIEAQEGLAADHSKAAPPPPEDLVKLTQKLTKRALTATAIVNVALTFIKLAIVLLSSSLVLVASLIDSVLDIVSSFVLYFAAKSSMATNKYKYPVGRSRLEPVGVIIFAAIMSMCSLFIIFEAVQDLISGIENGGRDVSVSLMSILVFSAAIAVKLALFVYCWYVQRLIRAANHGEGNHSVAAMMQDHLNDVVNNTFAVIVVLVASRVHSVWFLDPAGAILISVVIIWGWVEKGREHIRLIVGRSASHEFVGKVAYLALKHDPRIVAVDTIYVYHSGVNLIVEMHIVLPEEMPLKTAAVIGDTLERRFETLPGVERAFVHLDTDWDHKPEH